MEALSWAFLFPWFLTAAAIFLYWSHVTMYRIITWYRLKDLPELRKWSKQDAEIHSQDLGMWSDWPVSMGERKQPDHGPYRTPDPPAIGTRGRAEIDKVAMIYQWMLSLTFEETEALKRLLEQSAKVNKFMNRFSG